MVKRTIAIIGATEIAGAAIAKNLAKGQYRLLLFGHDIQKLETLSKEIRDAVPLADFDCLSCLVDATWEADIIISAVLPGMEKIIAEKIREVATQKIVIYIANTLGRTSLETSGKIGSSAAEELQRMLPHSKIVKAFSITGATGIARALANGEPIDSFVTGDDREAVQAVTEIVTTAGFHVINAGELATSRALELRQL